MAEKELPTPEEIVFSFDDVLMKAIEKYQKGVKEA